MAITVWPFATTAHSRDGCANNSGQITVPSGTFIAIAAGFDHSLGLRTDGTLVGWGNNNLGQVSVPSGIFSAIAAGGDHSLALRARTEYDGDLLISGTGSTASINRSINVAGDATIQTNVNFYNNPIANVAGKLILQPGAGFSGNGTIMASGLEMFENVTLPSSLTLANSGSLNGTGNLALANDVRLDVGLAATSVYSGSLTINTNAALTFTGAGFQTAGALFVSNGGELRMGPGQRVRFTGAGTNSGKVELLGSSALAHRRSNSWERPPMPPRRASSPVRTPSCGLRAGFLIAVPCC